MVTKVNNDSPVSSPSLFFALKKKTYEKFSKLFKNKSTFYRKLHAYNTYAISSKNIYKILNDKILICFGVSIRKRTRYLPRSCYSINHDPKKCR